MTVFDEVDALQRQVDRTCERLATLPELEREVADLERRRAPLPLLWCARVGLKLALVVVAALTLLRISRW